MAHKEHGAKQADVDLAEMLASKAAKAGSSIAQLQPPRIPRRALPDHAHGPAASDRSKKRRKLNGNTGLDHHDLLSSDIPETTMADTIEHPEFAPDASAQELPPQVRHLRSNYDVTTMSILSSAKIAEKVKILLLRVEKFSFADPKSKPGIVVLYAKSEVASKMISIVQIARQDIEHNKGKWWQYSKLDVQTAELKTKPVKRKGSGKTLSKWQKERAGGGSKEVKEVGGERERASEDVQHEHEVADGDEEMEDAFESMLNPKEADPGAKQSGNGRGGKIRAIPVMTIYFARVPVPGLKELYGSSDPPTHTTPGKRIALPTRVEPKVFFANERTFLSWLNFTVILGGLSIGLLNFGSDATSRICAGLFTIVAMGCMIYALVTFHWRARSIRLRGQGGFDDRFGPTVLAVVLAGAVVVNFVLRVTGT
ncbi:MAG: hypothetical protein ASARMPRED_002358 [Alectoria sarmentosa]|nr:MAG: hypothetical protein ASARMPRED_002358 [Alectoria sarmentosa]